MKKLLKFEFVLSMLVFMAILTSCKREANSIKLTIGEVSYYESTGNDKDLMDKLEKSGDEHRNKLKNIIEDGKKNGNESVSSILMNYGFDRIKDCLIPTMFVSMVLGFLLYFFAQGNKRMRNLGLFGLVITVPLVLLLIAFGGGWLMDVFGI